MVYTGADVMHPAPGSQSPSYAAVVANIDSHGARYITKTAIQLGRQEMIGDLRTMAKVCPSVDASYSYVTHWVTGSSCSLHEL